MAIKKYLSYDRLKDYDELIKVEINKKFDSSSEYIDSKILEINTSISNITNGDTVVEEATHAVSADSASSADKATKDDSGNTITTTYETKEDAISKFDEAKSYTDTKIKDLISSSAVDSKISAHNISEDSHEDIRNLISGLTERLNVLANSDDTTLDQMKEVVDYIKSNRALIESITTNKVNVSDIVDNLTSADKSKVLSANQGFVLKGLIDGLQEDIDDKVAQKTLVQIITWGDD